jgi:methionine synthase II (cobalamin-independent)
VEIGLDVVTDGEFRRWMFLNSFYDAVEGFRIDNVVNFRDARGEEVPLRVHEIVERLRPVESPAAQPFAAAAFTYGGAPLSAP